MHLQPYAEAPLIPSTSQLSLAEMLSDSLVRVATPAPHPPACPHSPRSGLHSSPSPTTAPKALPLEKNGMQREQSCDNEGGRRGAGSGRSPGRDVAGGSATQQRERSSSLCSVPHAFSTRGMSLAEALAQSLAQAAELQEPGQASIDAQAIDAAAEGTTATTPVMQTECSPAFAHDSHRVVRASGTDSRSSLLLGNNHPVSGTCSEAAVVETGEHTSLSLKNSHKSSGSLGCGPNTLHPDGEGCKGPVDSHSGLEGTGNFCAVADDSTNGDAVVDAVVEYGVDAHVDADVDCAVDTVASTKVEYNVDAGVNAGVDVDTETAASSLTTGIYPASFASDFTPGKERCDAQPSSEILDGNTPEQALGYVSEQISTHQSDLSVEKSLYSPEHFPENASELNSSHAVGSDIADTVDTSNLDPAEQVSGPVDEQPAMLESQLSECKQSQAHPLQDEQQDMEKFEVAEEASHVQAALATDPEDVVDAQQARATAVHPEVHADVNQAPADKPADVCFVGAAAVVNVDSKANAASASLSNSMTMMDDEQSQELALGEEGIVDVHQALRLQDEVLHSFAPQQTSSDISDDLFPEAIDLDAQKVNKHEPSSLRSSQSPITTPHLYCSESTAKPNNHECTPIENGLHNELACMEREIANRPSCRISSPSAPGGSHSGSLFAPNCAQTESENVEIATLAPLATAENNSGPITGLVNLDPESARFIKDRDSVELVDVKQAHQEDGITEERMKRGIGKYILVGEELSPEQCMSMEDSSMAKRPQKRQRSRIPFALEMVANPRLGTTYNIRNTLIEMGLERQQRLRQLKRRANKQCQQAAPETAWEA
eukprot:CAMPEP_0114276132 /NCGR_PEP_ID=MMETSP0059-20121206/73_1 /TAXON_ID=36894 /ORGANISM="Pyramimonas parkeae, Strain CCMP726" /LENGTH=830 /DNA_ID=CAMNT_0001396109 /DNA_START=30 /DNA_END=2522 /DNA_ORIENTATION=-